LSESGGIGHLAPIPPIRPDSYAFSQNVSIAAERTEDASSRILRRSVRSVPVGAERISSNALSALSEDGPPSVSEERLNAYGEALWAVYDLREIWRNIGPRVAQVIKTATPGRNDVCSCGSGKKYKKCCGA
jgi:uncharacterized protein